MATQSQVCTEWEGIFCLEVKSYCYKWDELEYGLHLTLHNRDELDYRIFPKSRIGESHQLRGEMRCRHCLQPVLITKAENYMPSGVVRFGL